MTAAAATSNGTRDPRKPWAPSSFTRLARTHALNAGGDAMFALAMAGTVFFSADTLDEARGQTALLLIFTIAPFALAAPLIGPLLDRAKGGRSGMIIALALGRAVLCVLLIRHRDTWLFFPEGLLMLVMSRGYGIAKGAVVPSTVRSDQELVKANAKLTLLGGLSAATAAGPAALLLWLGGPPWVLGLACLVFLTCAFMAAQLPKVRIAEEPPEEAEKRELRSIGILLAASSMALIRGMVGFLVSLVAFYSKDNDLPMLLGVAVVTGQGGFLTGSLLAPILRRRLVEEHIIMSALGAIVTTGLVCAVLVSDQALTFVVVAAALSSFVVGISGNVAKQSFDALVQRDAPDANRGRSFAKFEARFQLVWVLGALIPTALVLPLRLAYLGVAGVAAFGLASYLIGRQRAERGDDHRLIKVPRPDMARASRGALARVRDRGRSRTSAEDAPTAVVSSGGGSRVVAERPVSRRLGASRGSAGDTNDDSATDEVPEWGPAGTLPPTLAELTTVSRSEDRTTELFSDTLVQSQADEPTSGDDTPAQGTSSGVFDGLDGLEDDFGPPLPSPPDAQSGDAQFGEAQSGDSGEQSGPTGGETLDDPSEAAGELARPGPGAALLLGRDANNLSGAVDPAGPGDSADAADSTGTPPLPGFAP